jgi:tRNA 2-thiouridine synthesizing protein A
MNSPSISDDALIPVLVLDARGLDCPMPLLKAKQALRQIAVGEALEVLATDPGSWRDFHALAQQSGHVLLQAEDLGPSFRYVLRRTV